MPPVMPRPEAVPETGGQRPVPAEIERTAQEFEAVFLAQMLQVVGQPLRGPGATAGGGADAWGSMLVDAYARLISKAGGVGVADAVVREMLRMQENR